MPEKTMNARERIMQAFRDLVLSRRYDEIHVASIIQSADVSRSTFYEHFKNKDQLLQVSLTWILTPLAQCGFATFDDASVLTVLSHFRDVKQLANFFFSSPTHKLIVKELTALIELELAKASLRCNLQIPVSLIAWQTAESILGLVRIWLESSFELSASVIAGQLRISAQAIIDRSTRAPSSQPGESQE